MAKGLKLKWFRNDLTQIGTAKEKLSKGVALRMGHELYDGETLGKNPCEVRSEAKHKLCTGATSGSWVVQ